VSRQCLQTIPAGGARARWGVADRHSPCAVAEERMAGFGMIGCVSREEAIEVASGHRQCSAPAWGTRLGQDSR
jgi:hypothetical protein